MEEHPRPEFRSFGKLEGHRPPEFRVPPLWHAKGSPSEDRAAEHRGGVPKQGTTAGGGVGRAVPAARAPSLTVPGASAGLRRGEDSYRRASGSRGMVPAGALLEQPNFLRHPKLGARRRRGTGRLRGVACAPTPPRSRGVPRPRVPRAPPPSPARRARRGPRSPGCTAR